MLDFSTLYADPLSVGSITDYFPADGAQGPSSSSGPSASSGSGTDWGSLFAGGLNRWLDVEVWRATNGAGVPEWNKRPTPGSSSAGGAAGSGIGGNLPLLIGLGIGAFLLLRGG